MASTCTCQSVPDYYKIMFKKNKNFEKLTTFVIFFWESTTFVSNKV